MSEQKQVLPFFARYLETQAEDMTSEELDEVSGGAGDFVTQAYPSDGDAADSGYSTQKPKNPYDIGDFPTFPSNFSFPKFGNGSNYVK
jgi:Serine endopeptidase inhibitors